MRLTDLQDSKVKNLDGKTLGRVHEVHCSGGQVVALMCGARSFIERETARPKGRRIPWECVRKVADGEILVTDAPPKRGRKG